MIERTAPNPLSSRATPCLLFLIWAALALPGCATMFVPDCAQFKRDMKEIDYETRYRYSEYDTASRREEFRALPKPTHAAARLYWIELSDDRVSACSHLHIHKELFLERNPKRGMVLEQVREFYTSAGQLIATKREDVTAQLTRSGHYFSTVPLPIPAGAPPGEYRIVSKLVLQPKRGGRKATLASATTTFEVVPAP